VKPINSKDLPKVIGLGVATVGVLGFFAMTLMGNMAKKNETAPPAQPTAVAPPNPASGPNGAASPVTPGQSPTTVATNDRTIELGGPAEPFRKVLPEGGRPDPFPNVKIGRGRMPRMGGRLRGGPITVGNIGMSSMGGNLAPAAIPEPTVRLDGVVTDGTSYAMVSCNGRTEMYRVGARFGGMF
jgi:hypothetical protein